MQMVKQFLLGFFVFWFAVLIFMPKQELYYALEKELFKQGVEINEERLDEKLFSLEAKGTTLYVKGIKIATVDEIDFFTLLFYSSMHVGSVKIDDTLKSFFSQNIEKTVLTHSLLSPLKIFITSAGSFGLAEGVVDLKTKKLRIDFGNEKKLGSLRSRLKKDKKGWYYETSF